MNGQTLIHRIQGKKWTRWFDSFGVTLGLRYLEIMSKMEVLIS